MLKVDLLKCTKYTVISDQNSFIMTGFSPPMEFRKLQKLISSSDWFSIKKLYQEEIVSETKGRDFILIGRELLVNI